MGEAIVFSSADLEELLFYSDRIMVFFSGFVTEPIPVSQLDEEKLGSLIGGKGFEKIHA
jgi:simple sugar transport system ATP-binding protein